MNLTRISIPEAEHRLRELLAAVEAGERVTIQGDNGRTYTVSIQPQEPIVNTEWPGYSHAGSAKGLIQVPDDFDEPLDELSEYMG
ncbi:MAG TPA: hypothetical protein VND64_00970 [Pirellulales bacterium]|nr:hypothetical protein [Pirellulales bacterium]